MLKLLINVIWLNQVMGRLGNTEEHSVHDNVFDGHEILGIVIVARAPHNRYCP